MVKDEVWEQAKPENDYAYILELESSLGRKLTFDDFTTAPINWDLDGIGYSSENPQKDILIDRIGGLEGRKKLARMHLDRAERVPMKQWGNAWEVGRSGGPVDIYIENVISARKTLGIENPEDYWKW